MLLAALLVLENRKLECPIAGLIAQGGFFLFCFVFCMVGEYTLFIVFFPYIFQIPIKYISL